MDSVGLFVYAITRSLIRKLLFFLNTMVYFALLTISVSACHAKWSNSETVYRNHTILDQQVFSSNEPLATPADRKMSYFSASWLDVTIEFLHLSVP